MWFKDESKPYNKDQAVPDFRKMQKPKQNNKCLCISFNELRNDNTARKVYQGNFWNNITKERPDLTIVGL